MQTTLRQQLEKLKSGSLNRNEQKQILALFHRQEEEYAVKDEIYRQLESFADADTDPLKINAEFERLWKRLGVNNLEKRPRLINWTMVVNASAAMLILGLIIGNLVPVNSFRRNEKVFYTAIAPQGAVSETILPDSTVIFLNAGSKVRYAAGTEDLSREVYLDGEAWFAVKHSKKTPFIVHTGFYDVRVTGTRFNVKAYRDDDKVVTTLEEGSVQAESSGKMRMARKINLKAGEQLVYSKDKHTLTVTPVKPKIYSSWKDNKLIFVNMNLKDLIVLLERKYGVEILVADAEILNYHYDGTIKDETIIEVLDLLRETLPIHYTIQDQKIQIMKK